MRILCLVFIFATLTMFDVMGCDIACPGGGDTSEVCNKIGPIEFTTTKCESDNLVKCAMQEDNEIVTVTGGACATHTYENCETACPIGREVCGTVGEDERSFDDLCQYMTLQNCREADAAVKNDATLPEVKLLHYGDC